MTQFQVIVYTPPGPPEPAIAIAASRAHCIGVLDLEYTTDKKAALAAIKRMAEYASYEFGIKLDSHSEVFWREVIGDLPEKLSWVILTNGSEHLLLNQVKTFQRRGLSVLLEATCLAEAWIGEQCGVNGIIAKGYETGGRAGKETAFVLLQRLLVNLQLPVWAHGGVGRHTAAACYAAGAAGIVLDSQLALCQESPLPDSVQEKIASLDGNATICIGDKIGKTYRVFAAPGLPVIDDLLEEEKKLAYQNLPHNKNVELWQEAVLKRVGWESIEENLLFLGQDVGLAAPLARRYGTVGHVLRGIKKEVDDHCRSAREQYSPDEKATLIRSRDTQCPNLWEPKAGISDMSAFALEVAANGGLPFLALPLMTPSELKSFLQEARHIMGKRPWGVGIIGFLPPELLRQQIDIICEYHPPYALIAGGLPNQHKPLIDAGIITYTHVPSPGRLRMFLNSGDRRFIFEGQEPDGDIGPYTSFLLWERMIDELLEYLTPDKDSSGYHVLFAGGIHEAMSTKMVAVMAAPLVERGVRVGVLPSLRIEIK